VRERDNNEEERGGGKLRHRVELQLNRYSTKGHTTGVRSFKVSFTAQAQHADFDCIASNVSCGWVVWVSWLQETQRTNERTNQLTNDPSIFLLTLR
jgi:hypothetical protein